MNVAQFLEQLEGLDPDLEVRIAHQPSWPLQYHVGSVDQYTVYPDGGPSEEDYEYEPLLATAWREGAADTEFRSEPRMRTSRDTDESYEAYLAGFEAGQGAERYVYIAEGGQVYDAPYLPGEVSAELGWR